MIEALVLDWSGTLADDVELTLQVTNATLGAFGGRAVDLAEYRREFRIPVAGFYAPRVRAGASPAEIDDHFFHRYRELLADVPLFAGVEALLREAHARGVALHVLSTVPTDLLRGALEAKGLAGLFRRIEGGAADKRPALLRLIREEGLRPDRTIYVGDTAHDVETARAAGVRAGAALYGYGMPEALAAARPDDLLASVADLRALLDRDHLLATVPLVIPTVGGLLRRADGRLLFVRTRKWSGTWGIPGGKIDRGETMIAAYEREIHEETGLRARDHRFVMVQDCIDAPEFEKPRHFLLLNWISEVEDPETLELNYEIDAARWCSVAEADGLNLNRPTRIVIAEAIRLGLLPGPEAPTPKEPR